MQTLSLIHIILIINLSLMISYPLVRILTYAFSSVLPFSQQQQLRFSRVALLLSLCLPLIISYLPTPVHPRNTNSFILTPLLTQASTTLASHAINQSHITTLSQISLYQSNLEVLLLLLSIGVGLFYNYLVSIRQLYNLTNACQHYHQQGRIKLRFSDSGDSPFCWSTFHSQYIIIPKVFAENAIEMKMAIKHELQHIRQHDTNWQHYIAILKILFFYNPFFYLWRHLLQNLQEFSCDENITLKSPAAKIEYAQCLLKHREAH